MSTRNRCTTSPPAVLRPQSLLFKLPVKCLATPLTLLWAIPVALLATGPGCKKIRQHDCPKYVQVRRLKPQPDDVVVAEVNGRPILARIIRRRAERKGITAPEALQELIDEELLVQEAERRDLHRDRVVVEAGKQAAVYQLLAETFEREFTPRDVPDSDLRRIYKQKSARWFHRPELRRFAHAYVKRPWFKRGRRWTIDIERDRELKKVMQNFQRHVADHKPKDWKAFRALAESFSQGDQALTFGIALQAHKDLRRSFADALFALPGKGSFSEVIETRPWYHVAYLIEVVPRQNISYAQARDEIRGKVFPNARRKAFTAWVKQARKRCSIRVKPEHLPVGERAPKAPAKGMR